MKELFYGLNGVLTIIAFTGMLIYISMGTDPNTIGWWPMWVLIAGVWGFVSTAAGDEFSD